MPIYNIADLNVFIEPIYPSTAKRLAPYITNDTGVDIKITADDDKIKQLCMNSKIHCNPQTAESSYILNELCNAVLERFDGFFFHSSALMLNGEAYVFSAASGTGKSTHTSLWRKHFGDKVTMINDDKPIIRKNRGKFYIYGTPWMGKADIGNNIKAPVKAVFILKQGKVNSAVQITPGEVFNHILEATVVPRQSNIMSVLLNLLDEFFSSAPLFLLTCNLDDDAVTTAYNAANTYNSES